MNTARLLSLAGGCLIASANASDELPLVDLSGETNRHVVVAAGTEEVYQGHPTTVLSDDGKRLFCVWTRNHGGTCGPAAESLDGGRKWTRVDGRFPAVYAETHRNCPTLQKLKTPEGRERWLIFSRKGKWDRASGSPGRLGVMASDDCGLTWRETGVFDLPSAMPPTGFIQLKDGSCALFGQERKDPKAQNDGAANDQVIWMSVSRDGGITWGERRTVAAADQKNLCEPFALRSPDGNEIALLIRENRHTARSMMCFSSDEGKTWTKPVDTPWGLTGDRHEGVMLPDGRYVIAFRDQAIGSSTLGHYVAWVGTWDDIRNARSGQCRIRILKSWAGDEFGGRAGDTGYSGVELLPSGDIVCTTYVKYWPDARKNSVVSARIRAEDADIAHIAFACSESAKYEGLHPLFAKAFEFLRRPDLAGLQCGRYEIDGTNCWAMVSEVSLKPFAEENQYEVHRAFIDIQAPIAGSETIGVTKPEPGVFDGYNAEKDCVLFKSKGEPWTLKPGELAVFFPGKGAHAPGLSLDGPRKVRKVVIKVRAL